MKKFHMSFWMDIGYCQVTAYILYMNMFEYSSWMLLRRIWMQYIVTYKNIVYCSSFEQLSGKIAYCYDRFIYKKWKNYPQIKFRGKQTTGFTWRQVQIFAENLQYLPRSILPLFLTYTKKNLRRWSTFWI